MDTTIEKFRMWQRSSWPYWLYAKTMFALQPYRDDTFEATQIVENLWVGDIRSPCNKESLKENNIEMIVSAVYGAMAHHPFHFTYEKANLRDTEDENILDEIVRLLPEIRSQIVRGKGVLVHCMQGASRSVTIVTAYLIKYHNMKSEEALAFMKSKRSCVNPNQGYRDQLKIFEEMIKTEREEVGRKKKEL
jgi:dual specificity phosphatase 12